eukprot:5072078-Pleurochrysis_carterae.AAC.3
MEISAPSAGAQKNRACAGRENGFSAACNRASSELTLTCGTCPNLLKTEDWDRAVADVRFPSCGASGACGRVVRSCTAGRTECARSTLLARLALAPDGVGEIELPRAHFKTDLKVMLMNDVLRQVVVSSLLFAASGVLETAA